MKDFKKGLKLLLIPSMFIVGISRVNAASGNISVSANSKSVVVGNTFKVTTRVSSSDLGAWEYCISYDSNYLKLEGSTANSGNCVKAGVIGQTGQTETWTFKALKSGNSKVSIRSYAVYSLETEDQMNTSVGSVNITAKTQAEIEASYSKNNRLKSLGVEGYELEPAFNNDVKEYNVTVPSEVTKVNIVASPEDNTASITGIGERDVVEGSNAFDIVVTAQNGTTNTFKIVVNVEDKNPIEVEYDGDTYVLVKRSGLFEAPKGFVETTIKIKEFDIPALYNEVTKKTLVGLKSEDGKIYLFEYDDGKYERYYELAFNQITLNIKKMDTKLIPAGYSKFTQVINEESIEVYKQSKDSNFALVYGVDVASGVEGLYQIDIKNNTVQLFNEEFVKNSEKTNKKFLIIIATLGGVILLEFLMLLLSKKKNKRILDRIQNNKIEKVKSKAIKDAEKETIEFKEDKKQDTSLEETVELDSESKEVKKEKKKKSK